MSLDEKKPVVSDPPVKSSMEILSELFSTFDAEPPLIIKKEKDEHKKHKKSKKKHKHKDKKHKKKDRKRKRVSSNSSSEEYNLAQLAIKEEPLPKCIKREAGANVVNTEVKEESGSTTPKREKDETTNDKDRGSCSEDTSKLKSEPKTDRIIIKNLKFSSIFESTVREIKEKQDRDADSETCHLESSVKKETKDKHKRKHHKHKCEEKSKKHKEKKRSVERSRSRSANRRRSKERTPDVNVIDNKYDTHANRGRDTYYRSRSKDGGPSENVKYYKYRDTKDDTRDRDSRHRDAENDCNNKEKDKTHRHRDNPFYRTESIEKLKDSEKDDRWSARDRYRRYNDRDRDREKRSRRNIDARDSSHIDKKKLLEIARKNAIQMMKSGSLPGALTLGPQAQEKVIAAIKAGGKTIEELTDFCKTLSRKEEIGDLSSVSEDDSESDNEKAFHHPFQIKDRPTSITMNIKNSVPLPIKSTQERTTELRMQFPVSSGQQHRKTENEWVPVSPKKPEVTSVKPIQSVVAATHVSTDSVPLAIEQPTSPLPVANVVPAPVNAPPGPQVFPKTAAEANVDIGYIVSQRLSAIRKLQENPNDVQAITEIYKAQKDMQNWAESKQKPGQFTGSTGVQILSQAELSSGYQAWARKDQLQTAAPVSGGMGMHLLQKMGWRPGEGLGKEKRGALEPLLLEVKLDKKGLVANEEQKKKQIKPPKNTVKSLQGKHPVSLLGEYASKRKLGAPQYSVCFECGPDHKKNFLFKVLLNGVEYKPNVASPNKKDAKANAASMCLQQLGLLPAAWTG